MVPLRLGVMLVLLACDPQHATVSVGEAPGTRAHALTLLGGTLLLDRGGTYERPCQGNKSPSSKGGAGCIDLRFYVVPIVPASWRPNDPIPAWATCSNHETTYEACTTWLSGNTGELRGRVAARVGDSESGWMLAIADASRRHGVVAASAGPVLAVGRD